MAFKALASHTESLQALACAVRQDAGGDISAADVAQAMNDLSGNTLKSSVKKSIKIDDSKMSRSFAVWMGDSSAKNQKSLVEWQNSAAWTANKIAGSSYLKSGRKYIFYYSGKLDSYRGKYKEIATRIAKSAEDPMVKRIYENVSVGTGDKWNPSDIMALDSGSASTIEKNLKDFDPRKISKASREIHYRNLKMKAETGAKGKKALEMTEGMDELYEYNKYIDDLFKSGDLIGISLKKTETSEVAMKLFDHKDFKGLKESLNLDIEIESVDYKPDAMKCEINFTLAGETGHFMVVRGFESSKILANVQMQLQKGTAANHGKATLPAFSLITQLSKGMPAISATKKMRNDLFKGRRIPRSADHKFTDYRVFDRYAFQKQGSFSQASIVNDAPFWAEYCNDLSTDKMSTVKFLEEFNKKLGTTTNKNYKDAAKYLKNKVQSYEVGYVLEKGKGAISDEIKKNIMKSVYSLAASKGFRIFGKKKITDYMSSSTYLKVGG
tara:strand:- start:54 stop:1541 length:1488 start_codon:yes stop_codon:yes gene_type:complete